MTSALDLSRPCPYCDAEIGQLCIAPNGDRMYGCTHRARKESPPKRGRPRKPLLAASEPAAGVQVGDAGGIDCGAVHAPPLGALVCDDCNPDAAEDF